MRLQGARRGIFLRSFLIQGSWNPRTLIGSGMGWALRPALERLDGGERTEDRVGRASESFNAHPYLAGVALGALLRLEADGEEPEVIRRFREALRGPLGSLGDRLVWTALRPAAVFLALALAVVGLPPLWVVATFLIVYNVGHLLLRAWGVFIGFEFGRGVGEALARADLVGISRRVVACAALLMGLLAGALFAPALRPPLDPASWTVAAPAVLLFGWGWLRGPAVRWLAPWVAVAAIVGVFLVFPGATP